MSVQAYLKQFEGQTDITIINEELQKVDDPVMILKAVPMPRLVVVVPAEHSWPPMLNPGKNPTHKRVYDADLLAEHLHEAGWEPYILRNVEGNGWTWLSAEATRGSGKPAKKPNSKERRRLERAARFGTGATPAGLTSNSGTQSESKLATPTDTN